MMKPGKTAPIIKLLLLSLLCVTKLHAQSFNISVLQNKEKITVVDGVINPEHAPFIIQVDLHQLDGVYCYASFSDSIYKMTPADTIPNAADLSMWAMAESTFNEDKELIINPDGWHYWFYDSTIDWHRFDKELTAKGGEITAFKTVEKLYFTEGEKIKKLSELDDAPLYLFFVSAPGTKEEQRYKLKLAWK